MASNVLWKHLRAIFCVVGLISGSEAAEIDILPMPASADIAIIRGAITHGDSKRFLEMIEDRERVSVYLESPGGLIREALQIGAAIRLRNYSTVVTGGDGCYSACGLIWLSGARRYMSSDALIGFHAAYREEAGEFRESGVANAEIGAFLAHLGLRIEAIRFFTTAGPNDFLLLSPGRARELGIELFLVDGDEVATPYDVPTGDRFAERWVLYNILRSQCQGYFQPDTEVIQGELREAFDRGNEILGGEQWVNMWTQLLDDWAYEISARGLVLICVEADQRLRDQGLATGIYGPSFDCAKAGTPTERTMCADQDLWAKDRAMNSIYFWIRNNVEAETRKRILAVQREWLAVRNNCGADRNCLNSVYDQRLNELKQVLVE